jgi:hypothetical protein
VLATLHLRQEVHLLGQTPLGCLVGRSTLAGEKQTLRAVLLPPQLRLAAKVCWCTARSAWVRLVARWTPLPPTAKDHRDLVCQERDGADEERKEQDTRRRLGRRLLACRGGDRLNLQLQRFDAGASILRRRDAPKPTVKVETIEKKMPVTYDQPSIFEKTSAIKAMTRTKVVTESMKCRPSIRTLIESFHSLLR